jgi:hypothetical protein
LRVAVPQNVDNTWKTVQALEASKVVVTVPTMLLPFGNLVVATVVYTGRDVELLVPDLPAQLGISPSMSFISYKSSFQALFDSSSIDM